MLVDSKGNPKANRLYAATIDCQQVTQDNKFITKLVYHNLIETQPLVQRRKLLFNNVARPRACFTLWLVCQNRLTTKDKLYRFGMIDNKCYGFCDQRKTIQHFLFRV